MSHDNWKATNPDDERLGRATGEPQRYRCRDCAWRGTGVLAASDHFWATDAGHTVLIATDTRFAQWDAEPKKASA